MEQKGRRFRSDKEKPKKAIPIAEAEEETTIEQEITEETPDIAEAEQPAAEEATQDHDKKAEKEKDERLRKKNEKKLEKLMKKKRRREEHSDRDVLSYEDMPLEERRERTESSPRFKK